MFTFPELQTFFYEDIENLDQLYILLEFEKVMFNLNDISIQANSLDIQKNYPLLTNSFNVFQSILDTDNLPI